MSSLARKYDYDYTYSRYYDYKEYQPKKFEPQRRKIKNYKALRHQAIFLFVVGILCYFGNVVLSECYVARTNALVQLKKQEAILVGENQTLKIDVDKLKSPERITQLASSKLGLSTARSNIYMHADKSGSKDTSLQVAKK